MGSVLNKRQKKKDKKYKESRKTITACFGKWVDERLARLRENDKNIPYLLSGTGYKKDGAWHE
jgi:hypothetical protein